MHISAHISAAQSLLSRHSAKTTPCMVVYRKWGCWYTAVCLALFHKIFFAGLALKSPPPHPCGLTEQSISITWTHAGHEAKWWRSGKPSLNHLPFLFATFFFFTALSPSFAACSLPSTPAFHLPSNPHFTPLDISLSTTLTLAFHRLSLSDWWPHHWAGSWEGVQVLLVKVIPHFRKYFIWGARENERGSGGWRPEAYLFLVQRHIISARMI